MKNIDSPRKNSTAGKTVWHPLPPEALDVVFDANVSPLLLGAFNESAGEWDKETGVFVHYKSGLLFVLAGTQNGIERLNKFIKEQGTPSLIRSKVSGLSPKDIKEAFSDYVASIGGLLSIVHPYEYGPLDVAKLKRRYFTESPGWSFLQEGSNDFPGTIRVKSVANTLAPIDVPVSHSSQIPKSVSDARSQDYHKSFMFKEESAILEAMFNDRVKDKYVTDIKPQNLSLPLDRNIENIDGQISFVNNSDIKTAPVASIGNDSFINTASFVQDGSIKKTTLEGPYVRNANPGYPSSHFYPHPEWIRGIFIYPKSIIRDPQTTTAIITIALLSSQGQKHTQYNYIYNKTSTIIDNDSIERSLYK